MLAPEVQLLHKSGGPRVKDEADFAQVARVLERSQRTWLIEALQLTDATHPWVE
ncbi:hypothetical protein GTQ99_09235 [Kineococcus sp. T13]|uniref:hypothetical protein n=1 Tax=Kineococcus vitellinus TaxID=2696565 RepID=UPI001412BB80|nr:hypothetical protein [Kineococcus vitellinus]NAZ75601.1 hypothetical protein [Kineococcus vitellinus]